MCTSVTQECVHQVSISLCITALELEFGLGGYSATEAGGVASLVIEKIGVNERPVTVRFSTQNGTTAGSDYHNVTHTISLAIAKSVRK